MIPTSSKDQTQNLSGESFSGNEPLSMVAICLDDESWRFINVFSEQVSLVQTRLRLEEYRSHDQDSIVASFGEPAPDICLIDFDRDRRRAVVLAERLHASMPGTALFAVSSQAQPDSILEAMRSGCSEYLIKPLDRDQMLSAVARVSARRREKKDTDKAQVLAFMGAKGGCGVTTIVTQMGALLAKSYTKKTLVVDLHPDFGDSALYLGLTKSRYDFFELLENTDRLDADFLQSFLLHHSSGLDLVPAPEGMENSREALRGSMAQTFDFIRQRYEFILADLPPGLNETNLELIQYCDHVYLVTVAEVSAIRNILRQLEYFSRRDVPPEKVHIILNRHQKRSVVTDMQIEKVIGQKIFWRVPNHYPQVVKTIHEGDPVAQLSSSEVAQNLHEWAGTFARKPGEKEEKKTSGIRGLWSR
jgi:pilus assembly protein CpaE